MTDNQHAIGNTKAWFASIREMVAAYDRVDPATRAGEDAKQAIEESPLSVQVRSGWYLPGAATMFPGGPSAKPAEYEILLTTGGPALRIIGSLSEHGEPESATLQWQDWGTPWTDLHMSELPVPACKADAILLGFANHFYFGE